MPPPRESALTFCNDVRLPEVTVQPLMAFVVADPPAVVPVDSARCEYRAESAA
jgi:hypothetical protein